MTRLRAKSFALEILGFIHYARRQAGKPFFQRTIQEEIGKHGHGDDRQKADGNKINQQPRFYLGSELEFAPLASQLEEVAHKDKGEDYEGDEV